MTLWRTVLRASALVAVAGVTLLAPVLLYRFGYSHALALWLTMLVAAAWVGAGAVRSGSMKWGFLSAIALVALSLSSDVLQAAAVPTAALIVLGMLATQREADDAAESSS